MTSLVYIYYLFLTFHSCLDIVIIDYTNINPYCSTLFFFLIKCNISPYRNRSVSIIFVDINVSHIFCLQLSACLQVFNFFANSSSVSFQRYFLFLKDYDRCVAKSGEYVDCFVSCRDWNLLINLF